MDKITNPTQEWWFEQWVKEAIKAGYIEKYTPEKDMPSFTLFEGLSKITTEQKVVYAGTSREKMKTLTHKHVLLAPITYTPDGGIVWTKKAKNILFTTIEDSIDTIKNYYFIAKEFKGKYITILDVKSPTGTNRHSDTPFQFTRKWMWEKHKIYVNKVMLVPPKKKSGNIPKGYLFNETWTPKRYLWSDKLTKTRTINSYIPITIEQFLLP